MTDKNKSERQDVLAAVMRLLTHVPDEPLPAERTPEWRKSEKKTPPDSLY